MIETLKKEKKEVGAEAEQEAKFYSKMSEEERKEIDEKQQGVLNKRIKTLEERETEDKQRIEFLEKEE